MIPTLHTIVVRHLDAVLPIPRVLEQVRKFLGICDWKLEIDNEVIEIPQNAELTIRSRAFIKADLEDALLGDHYEAIVLLGKEFAGDEVCARYGVLKNVFQSRWSIYL